MDSRDSGNDGIPHTEVLPVLGPFIQWQAVLTPQNGCVSPALHSIALSSIRPSHDESPKHAHTLPSSLCRLVPSYPSTHQDPTEPKLEILRKQERLDEIIAGGETEWEQMLALRAWVAVQWVHRAPHEFRRCCPWDAPDYSHVDARRSGPRPAATRCLLHALRRGNGAVRSGPRLAGAPLGDVRRADSPRQRPLRGGDLEHCARKMGDAGCGYRFARRMRGCAAKRTGNPRRLAGRRP